MSEVVLAQNPAPASQICGLEGADGLPATHHAPMKIYHCEKVPGHLLELRGRDGTGPHEVRGNHELWECDRSVFY